MNRESLVIRPGVGAVVANERGHILLHRRVVGDAWAPPSGSVNPGEDLRAALHRELREETRLDVQIQRVVGIYSDPEWQIVDYPDGRSVHFVTTVFTCRKRTGRLQGSDEATVWKWFEPEELPENTLPYGEVWLGDALHGEGGPVVR